MKDITKWAVSVLIAIIVLAAVGGIYSVAHAQTSYFGPSNVDCDAASVATSIGVNAYYNGTSEEISIQEAVRNYNRLSTKGNISSEQMGNLMSSSLGSRSADKNTAIMLSGASVQGRCDTPSTDISGTPLHALPYEIQCLGLAVESHGDIRRVMQGESARYTEALENGFTVYSMLQRTHPLYQSTDLNRLYVFKVTEGCIRSNLRGGY